MSPLAFNQKLLFNIFIFLLVFLGFALIHRLIMHFAYLDWQATKDNLDSVFRMYQYGLAYDLRIIASALALPFLLGYLCSFFQWGRKKFFTFFAYYVAICGFLFTLSYLINYFYFQLYHTQIDVFIFGLVDDNTQAILKIAFEDYPLIWGILFSLAVSYLCFWTTKKLPCPYFHLKSSLLIGFNVIFLFFFVAGIRGGFFSEPLLRAQSNVSNIKTINHLVPNPIIAFVWASSDYKLNSDFFPVSQAEGERLAKEAKISLFATTKKNDFLQNNPPNVILNLMESFGSNLLSYDDPKTFDLLGSFRHHLNADFSFFSFLPSGNGTAPSLSSLFFGSPSVKIGLSSVKNKVLEGNAFSLYAQNGYEVIFITAGNASWFGYGDYARIQGANQVYDANTLLDLYPEAKAYRTAYGVPDEYAYKLLEKLLLESKKPLFACILTISNHPPEIIPTHYKPYPLQKDLSKVLPSEKAHLISLAYQYANDSFGKFLDFIKTSSFKNNTIIAATGDHKMRSLSPLPPSSEFQNFATPLYLYIPKAYLQAIGYHYNPQTLGSHKDIFPTLLTYSLSNVKYFSNGGTNMLGSLNPKDRFAYNEAIFANSLGVYMGGGDYYPWSKSPLISTTPIQAPKEMLEQIKAYKEFQWWQIRARTQGIIP